MRRVNICEERGSGIDKVVSQVEFHQLPPPLFRATAESTVAVLFGERAFAKMTKDERVRACYQHACLQYVSNAQMTNATLRKRFGVGDRSYSVISRIIKDTIEAGLVKPSGETLSRKYASTCLSGRESIISCAASRARPVGVGCGMEPFGGAGDSSAPFLFRTMCAMGTHHARRGHQRALEPMSHFTRCASVHLIGPV